MFAELGQALFVLSDALDLVGVGHEFHGKRVAWLVQHLLEALNQPALVPDARHVALVHDCGSTSVHEHLHLVDQSTLSDQHCELGAQLLERFSPLAHLADCVRFHHTPWANLELIDPAVALIANAIFLADRIDVIHAQAGLMTHAETVELIDQRLLQPYGSFFHQPLLEAARAVLARGEVMLMLQGNGDDLVTERPVESRPLLPHELRELAMLFAQAVDAKSAFTAAHSYRVTAVANYLGQRSGLTAERAHALEIAALLHDLGKLRVPSEVLDKPGPLTPDELLVMRAHADDSRVLLARIKGFEAIAIIAGMHHEYLDGSGYPSGLQADQLPLEARILTIADIFQALAQNRPYRPAMEPEAIMRIIDDNVNQGRLEGLLVEMLKDDLPYALQLARGETERAASASVAT